VANVKSFRVTVKLRTGGQRVHEGVRLNYWTAGGILHVGTHDNVQAMYAHNTWLSAEREAR
jgi:hypothetical protein